jgi:hypothetical protein
MLWTAPQEAVEQMATLDRVSFRAANAIPFDRRKRRAVASHRWQTISAFWAASSLIAWPRRCLFMAVCTESPIRIDGAMESPKLVE